MTQHLWRASKSLQPHKNLNYLNRTPRPQSSRCIIQTFPNTQHHLNTHGQVLQLQLTDRVVGFNVFRDESELEVCILEDAVSVLPLRPVLGTFDLQGRTDRENVWPRRGKQPILAEGLQPLTDPFSMTRFSITTPRLRCSHTISQKLPHVFGRGPCVAWKDWFRSSDIQIKKNQCVYFQIFPKKSDFVPPTVPWKRCSRRGW